MKLGVLFSGGKDSTYAAWLAKNDGNEIVCLISIFSENKDSFMFHTPAIELTKKQAKLMNLPIIVDKTKGEKELELRDLKRVIRKAVDEFKIDGIVTGALASVYQETRIGKICDEMGIKCINPLWGKSQVDLLGDLVRNNFECIITGVAAFPLDRSWIGRKIDGRFIEQTAEMQNKYKINPAGEGGEFESLVVNCPMFAKRLDVKLLSVLGEANSWRGVFE